MQHVWVSTLLFVVVLLVFLVVGWLAIPRKRDAAAPKKKVHAPLPEPPKERVASPLGVALAEHNLDQVRALLAEWDPNSAARDDMPALHTATQCGFAEAIPVLLEAGADIDFVEPRLGSALMFAITLREWTIVKLLLDANIPVDLVNEGGAHALHVAAYTGRTETVRKLLDRGASIHQPNLQGGTALRSAASAGHVEVVRLLLQRGAEINHIDMFDKTEIDYAREGGHRAVVALLESADRQASLRHWRGSAPFANLLPYRKDATLQILMQAQEAARKDPSQRAVSTKIAVSSIEAPSIVQIANALLPSLELTMPSKDDPDPRKPTRRVSLCLWTYEGTTAHPLKDSTSQAYAAKIVLLAELPYLQRRWSSLAKEFAAEVESKSLPSLLANMASPPTTLFENGVPLWDAWFRAQVATAFIASYVGDEPWAPSKRRELLYEVLDGPADWANTAVIVALVDVARREENAREDIIKKLFETARRPVCPPIFQHIVQPAAWALDELGEEKAREEFREIIAAF